MGQTYSIEVTNNSKFSSVEISLDGRDSSLISKGRTVKLTPEYDKGTGKCRIYRDSKMIRECSFSYNMATVHQEWEIKDDGLFQPGFFSPTNYPWSFVDDS